MRENTNQYKTKLKNNKSSVVEKEFVEKITKIRRNYLILTMIFDDCKSKIKMQANCQSITRTTTKTQNQRDEECKVTKNASENMESTNFSFSFLQNCTTNTSALGLVTD